MQSTIRGTSSITVVPSASRAAAISFRAEFLAPLIRTDPTRGRPPVTTRRSTRTYPKAQLRVGTASGPRDACRPGSCVAQGESRVEPPGAFGVLDHEPRLVRATRQREGIGHLDLDPIQLDGVGRTRHRDVGQDVRDAGFVRGSVGPEGPDQLAERFGRLGIEEDDIEETSRPRELEIERRNARDALAQGVEDVGRDRLDGDERVEQADVRAFAGADPVGPVASDQVIRLRDGDEERRSRRTRRSVQDRVSSR